MVVSRTRVQNPGKNLVSRKTPVPWPQGSNPDPVYDEDLVELELITDKETDKSILIWNPPMEYKP